LENLFARIVSEFPEVSRAIAIEKGGYKKKKKKKKKKKNRGVY